MAKLKKFNELFDKTEKLMFRFSFSLQIDDDDDDNAKEIVKGFSLIPPDNVSISDFWHNETDETDKIYDEIQNEIDSLDLESVYGVHDLDGSFDNKTNEYFFGYCTYEVEESKIDELMEIWKNIFKKLNFQVGEIIDLETEDHIENFINKIENNFFIRK